VVTFVDTSAIYAYLDARDAEHPAAAKIMGRLLDAREQLITHSYVLVETIALLQRRIGVDAVRTFVDDLLPLMRVVWVDEPLHRRATGALLGSRARGISLVDMTSFAVMRELGARRTFAFDRDFEVQGFELLAEEGTDSADVPS
jgi:predicted nucleic acid-binding protein